MRPLLRLLFVVVFIPSLLPGCAAWRKFRHTWKKHATEREKVPQATQLIGTVVLSNADGAFALLDNGSQPSPPPGTTVESRSPDGSTAQLRVTAVRKRPFVVVDIVSGTPKKGDEVFQKGAEGRSNQ